MIRSVIDANVIISGTIAPLGTSAVILQAWRAEYFELVTCPSILEEVAEKLRLPRIRDKYHVREEDVVALLLRISQTASCVPGLAPVSPAPPDPDDTMVFSAALESKADCIVTGDKLLLGFAWPGPGEVVSPRQFWEQELPSRLALGVTFPVFAVEDVQAKGFFVVEVEGRPCLALFTSEVLAESYCRTQNILAEPLRLQQPAELVAYLQRVSTGGCGWVAFNPVGQHAVIQPVAQTLAAFQSRTDLPG